MKKAILLFLLFAAGCTSKDVKLSISNPLDIARYGEMVEVKLSSLGYSEGASLLVKDTDGNEIPSQITYDGLLIFQADVEAKGTARYSVIDGVPQDYVTFVCGRQYPQRVDDFAWESDLIAFRIYGPALQKSGERAFGNDIWLKNNTSLPVVEDRYNAELNQSISYHKNHGNGFDCYKVGPTLGAGGTAILENNEIIYPYCYSECNILDNGPLRMTASFKYLPTELACGPVVENRVISIDKGSFLNRTSVWFEGQTTDLHVLTGIVLHESTPRTLFSEKQHFISYAEPTEGAPEEGEIFVGTLFPDGWTGAENRNGHASACNTIAVGGRLTYYWGALWSKSTAISVPDKESFDALMSRVASQQENPLQVTIIK